METPFKRRRIDLGPPRDNVAAERSEERRNGSTSDGCQEGQERELPFAHKQLDSLRTQRRQSEKMGLRRRLPRHSPNRPGKFHPRNSVDGQVNMDHPTPKKTAVASVVDVVVQSGESVIANVLQPVESPVLHLPGFVPITLNPNPAQPTPPPKAQNPQPVPNLVTQYPHAPHPTPAPAPNSISPTPPKLPAPKSPPNKPEPQAPSNNPVPKSPPQTPSPSRIVPEQPKMSISVPGSNSQQVLSPPPTTPLPPGTPKPSAPGNPTGSYFFMPPFASSAPGSPQSSLPASALPPSTSPLPNLLNAPLPTNANSSVFGKSKMQSSYENV